MGGDGLERRRPAGRPGSPGQSATGRRLRAKFFCGFTLAEIAVMHEVSERTVQRQWEKARLFLHQALS